MQNMLQSRYYNIGEREEGKCLVHTKVQAKFSDIILQEVHCIGKGMDPNTRLEKQIIKPIMSSEVKSVTQIIPTLGQGIAGIKLDSYPHG